MPSPEEGLVALAKFGERVIGCCLLGIAILCAAAIFGALCFAAFHWSEM